MYDESSPYHDGESIFSTSKQCANCGINPPVEGPNKLCEACRQSFIKYPIPKWIWAFAAGVLIIMIFGFARMGEYMSYSIHLAKAEKAINEHKYMTAQHELTKVLAKFPDKLEVKAYMFIAAIHNEDGKTLSELFPKLKDAQFDDEALLKKVDEAITFYASIAVMDSLTQVKIDNASKDSVAGLDRLASQVDSVIEHDYRINAILVIASKYYDMKKYDKSRVLLEKVLQEQPMNYPALSLIAAINRNEGRFDEAVAELNQLLIINQEDVSILAQLSRTELKRSNDKKAAEWAKKALELDAQNIYALEANCLLQYFKEEKDKSQETFATIKQIERTNGDSSVSKRIYKIISGQEKYR